MTDLQIERREMPAVPDMDQGPVDRFDTYAVVTSGHMRGEVERFCYWNPRDENPLDVVFEARVWGLPEHFGTADVAVTQPSSLHAVADVGTQLAALLEEAPSGAWMLPRWEPTDRPSDLSSPQSARHHFPVAGRLAKGGSYIGAEECTTNTPLTPSRTWRPKKSPGPSQV